MARLTLDDFVYDQKPTDAILERIEAIVAPVTDETVDERADVEAQDVAPPGEEDVERQDAKTPR